MSLWSSKLPFCTVSETTFCSKSVFCDPANVKSLWTEHLSSMSEDHRNIKYIKEQEVVNKVLEHIRILLEGMGKQLEYFDLPSIVHSSSYSWYLCIHTLTFNHLFLANFCGMATSQSCVLVSALIDELELQNWMVKVTVIEHGEVRDYSNSRKSRKVLKLLLADNEV